MDESFTTSGLQKGWGLCCVRQCQAPVTADNSVLITNNTSQFIWTRWESDQIGSQDA